MVKSVLNSRGDDMSEANPEKRSFIDEIVLEDIAASGGNLAIMTRFPPEPNGYLHIGHAKAMYVDFMTARKYGGKCNLRMDDTNPSKEDESYVRAIIEDIRWLGFEYNALYYASDYFEKMFELAVQLIKKGLAYVCDLTAEQIKEYRGTLTEPGRESPYRNRSVEENLDLFYRMRNGEFPDGSRVLRAKIDMASPNINMRDPVIYRILREHHYRTGDKWCIYPMYDFAHPLEDAIEGITHSLCTLEFEDHRPLYNWFIENLDGFEVKPKQIEFARLNMTRTIMSKRYLKKLVDSKVVSGWDDPRMPTISGMRRRGYPAEAILDFCERIGVAKSNSEVDVSLLEHCVRESLDSTAPRVMAVINPVKVVITNYPADKTEELAVENNPLNPEAGMRTVTFSRDIYIEREDFMEDPPAKFFRLKPGGEVRLKSAYIIKCESVKKDANGNITEIECTYDPESKSGEQSRKVKGTLHWVNARDCIPVVIRNYDYLLNEGEGDFAERINPNSLIESEGFAEKSLAQAKVGDRFQFLRQGFYCKDPDSTDKKAVLNKIVGLKDTWAKLNK
ncbi:MAG TPA: glutamine--tRNA ligase/YqeY domain fusion protein [Clostridia bacterium]|nr:glutamine--tRNA ligase/YqeY domain fusion protein [Clostridia bacterium]